MLGGLSCATNICLVLYLNNEKMFFEGRTYSGENAPLALIAFSWHSIKAGHCITCRLLKSVCWRFCFSLTFMQRSHVLASTYNTCRVCICQTSVQQKIRMRAVPNGLTGLVLKGLEERIRELRVCLKVKMVVLRERSPYYQYLAYVYISWWKLDVRGF